MQKQIHLDQLSDQILFLEKNDLALVLWKKRSRKAAKNNIRAVEKVSLEREINIHKVFDKLREPK